MNKESGNQKKIKALNIAFVIRSFLEEIAKGVTALGESVHKSGLLLHLIAFWCIIWGGIGIFITLALIFE